MPGQTLPFWCVLWMTVLVCLSAVRPAGAQVDDVVIGVDRDFIGIAGNVRPGGWTPIRLTAQNRAAENRAVICRWVLNDFDGDRVYAQRRATLNPQRVQHVWLYATPPVNVAPNRPWTLQVIDAQTERLLADEQVVAPNLLARGQSALGVCSSASLGLAPYTRPDTRHEAVNVLRGLSLATLPDRWYGLAGLQALVWTQEGGQPDGAEVTLEIQQALREWVRRGGHLVVVLPAVGQTWTSSGLADLMPVGADQMRRVDDFDPLLLGTPRTPELFPVPAIVFDVSADDDVAVLARDRQNQPYVVAKRYGFGRVTLIGVDLSDRRLVRMGLPEGRYPIWNDVFHWQSPVFRDEYVQSEIEANRMSRPDSVYRTYIQLDRFVPTLIAMRNTTAPALLAAIVLFGVYWLVAGPGAFALLKRQGAQRHNWVVFVGVVVVFSLVAWGGALVMRPRHANIAHFSVVDFDAATGAAHTRSWLSLFVPDFGRAQVSLDPQRPESANTLASPGLAATIESAGFLDPQPYVVNAAAPNRAAIPVRATAKQFELDYLGELREDHRGLNATWVMPQGRPRIEGFWPTGRLSHGLPGDLRDVLIVYCPGNEEAPWVWRHGAWPAGELLELGQPREAYRLVQRPNAYGAERNWESEGFLGQLIGHKTGLAFGEMETIADNVLIQAVEMLSFHSALPPPNFRLVEFGRNAAMYQRGLARAIDITPLTAGRRLIVIGYLEDSPLPAPLTVDGEPVPAEGWTVVRWVYDF